ncbi:hypothetical protein KARL1_139 [Acinetobacter phage KARL-1]|uniref:Lipoprotein n=1 Tax=Acinetobacter phage KARL-1 TaxID=2301662 RepID=A0A385IIP5_9CAUD|nr:hypothetical protein HYP70_gp139 [Acinetobacter phage KARL-1]AXY82758.1 hypothetical protein KARL1_139 [Acinetobacter phage KARL-1]
MKKLFIVASIIGLVGCSEPSLSKESDVGTVPLPTSQTNKAYVDLSKVDGNIQGFDLEFDWEYDLAERYGTNGFKAIYYCGKNYDSMLSNIDTSTDYGSTVLSEYQANVRECATNSLRNYSVIPEAQRHKIPRADEPGQGLELSSEEEANFNSEDRFNTVYPKIVENYEGTEYRNDPRFKELLPVCAANNMSIKDDKEFVEAVEFCALKGM